MLESNSREEMDQNELLDLPSHEDRTLIESIDRRVGSSLSQVSGYGDEFYSAVMEIWGAD